MRTGDGNGQRAHAALATLRARLAPAGTRRGGVAAATLARLATTLEHLAGSADQAAGDSGTQASSNGLAFRHVRAYAAAEWLRGNGLEIGALDLPMPLPHGATARYVDRKSAADLRVEYPELAGQTLVDPDIVDDGERLRSIVAESVDFVVANHFLEHCQDPIGALQNMLRVVRPGGIVFLAIPDKRKTFDHARPVTRIDHVMRDHIEGPEWSLLAHFKEYDALVDHGHPGSIEDRMLRNDSIHFHVWTPLAFAALLAHCQETLELPFELSLFRQNDAEFLAVLTRTPTQAVNGV